jgi:hypothetical protein
MIVLFVAAAVIIIAIVADRLVPQDPPTAGTLYPLGTWKPSKYWEWGGYYSTYPDDDTKDV